MTIVNGLKSWKTKELHLCFMTTIMCHLTTLSYSSQRSNGNWNMENATFYLDLDQQSCFCFCFLNKWKQLQSNQSMFEQFRIFRIFFFVFLPFVNVGSLWICHANTGSTSWLCYATDDGEDHRVPVAGGQFLLRNRSSRDFCLHFRNWQFLVVTQWTDAQRKGLVPPKVARLKNNTCSANMLKACFFFNSTLSN